MNRDHPNKYLDGEGGVPCSRLGDGVGGVEFGLVVGVVGDIEAGVLLQCVVVLLDLGQEFSLGSLLTLLLLQPQSLDLPAKIIFIYEACII